MQDIEQAGPSRPQALSPHFPDTISIGSDQRVATNSPVQTSRQARPSHPLGPTTRDLQDALSVRSGSRASTNNLTTFQVQPNELSHSSTTRAYSSSAQTVIDLRGRKWTFDSIEQQATVLTELVSYQLDVMESLLVEMDGDKAQLGRRALQCERRLEDFLMEHRVVPSR